MPLAAKLYAPELPSNRRSDRRPVMLDGTLRDATLTPHDVTISDLSRHGFSGEFPTQFALDSRLRLGLSGIGTREALVMWRRDGQHGCAFVEPLTFAEVEVALTAETVVPGPFAERQAAPAPAAVVHPGDERLPGWMRLTIVVTLPVLMWGGIIWAGAHLFG